MDLTQLFQISIYLNNNIHDNGMTLKDYADAVLSGSHPILSHQEFDYHFGATDEDIKLVSDWCMANGLQILMTESAIATIKVKGPLDKLVNLFNTSVEEITDEIRTYYVNTNPIVIPKEIASAVRSIGGFDQSFLAKKNIRYYKNVSDPDLGDSYGNGPVTPPQMCTAYKAPVGDGYGGCIGIFELGYNYPDYQEGWYQPDVDASFSRIGLSSPSITTKIIDNAYFHTNSSGESMLDIYCAGAAAPRAKIIYYIGVNGGTTNINDVIYAAANDTVNNPSVLSISWGIGDGTQYDTAFQTCVAKGITVFVSSGDSGAENLSMANTCCSQYVVSAGGTNVTLDNSNNLISEVGWGNDFGISLFGLGSSGGGHSASITVPTWQSGLTYVTTTLTNPTSDPITASLSSPTLLSYRGVPDWSAPADPSTGYQFYFGGNSTTQGSLEQVGGTSASAPFLAGLWVRLTQLLGYRIPFNMTIFYSNSNILFNDVTTGNNRDGFNAGYVCTAGWDAVTGLGSPKADQIYKYFHTGQTFPKQYYGFRPSSGPAYPRRTTGAR